MLQSTTGTSVYNHLMYVRAKVLPLYFCITYLYISDLGLYIFRSTLYLSSYTERAIVKRVKSLDYIPI